MSSYKIYVSEDEFTQSEHSCLPDTPFSSPHAENLCRWWWRNSKEGIPLKSRFDVIEHSHAAQDIFLVEVLGDGSYRNRIVGERAKSYVEDGRVGSIIRADDERRHIRILHQHYTRVVEERIPIKQVGTFARAERNRVVFEGVDCPLSLDGVSVSHIVGVLTIL